MDTTEIDLYDKPDEEARARALEFARNTKLKFERVYKSARKAFMAGDYKTALLKCRAAVDLLDVENFYGPNQDRVRKALIEQIAKLDVDEEQG
jgi:hypothetical protein